MKIYKESKVLLEVRRIKEKLSKEAARLGPEKFYMSLNGTAARLAAKYRSPRPTAPSRRSAARKAKRRALADTLPYSPSSDYVLHDQPAKKRKVH